MNKILFLAIASFLLSILTVILLSAIVPDTGNPQMFPEMVRWTAVVVFSWLFLSLFLANLFVMRLPGRFEQHQDWFLSVVRWSCKVTILLILGLFGYVVFTIVSQEPIAKLVADLNIIEVLASYQLIFYLLLLNFGFYITNKLHKTQGIRNFFKYYRYLSYLLYLLVLVSVAMSFFVFDFARLAGTFIFAYLSIRIHLLGLNPREYLASLPRYLQILAVIVLVVVAYILWLLLGVVNASNPLNWIISLLLTLLFGRYLYHSWPLFRKLIRKLLRLP